MQKENLDFLLQLESVIKDRLRNPNEKSYTSNLASGGLDKVLQKVGEESVEYIIDAKNMNKPRAIEEAADLIYHLLISLQMNNIDLIEVIKTLESRSGK